MRSDHTRKGTTMKRGTKKRDDTKKNAKRSIGNRIGKRATDKTGANRDIQISSIQTKT
jgi:hypothetical protein